MEGADWDLQAVVRGCGGGGGAGGGAAASRDPFFSLPPPLLQQDGDGGGVVDNDLMFCFPNLLGRETSAQELEQLYKPFVPQTYSPPPPPPPPLPLLHQQKVVMPLSGSPSSSSSSSSAVSLLNRAGVFFGGVVRQPQQQQQRQHQQRPLATTTTRSKRRKNQQKRMVCHVPADGLPSDMWSWRKYGQKPIKGSPHPRGYYRCSSSKGCLARKQVERSRADPGVFIITYTAEHNHPVPTHRNSLAGSTRHKFTQTSGSSPPHTTAAAATTLQLNCSSAGDTSVPPTSLSPTTPLTSPTTKKEGGDEEADDDNDNGNDNDNDDDDDDYNEEGMLLVSDMEVLGEDDVLFLGVDGIHNPCPDGHFQPPFSPTQWIAGGGTTMSAGGG